jgi:anti-anti-sigma factor
MSNNDIIPGFDDEKDKSLKIHLQEVPDIENGLIFVLNGYIDTYNANYFQKRVQRAIETGFIRLIFNCNNLTHISSTGIGSFSVFLKMVKPQGGDVAFFEVQPEVYEVFQLLGFSHFFHFNDNLEECIGFFRGDTAAMPEIAQFPKIFACPACSQKLQAVEPGRFRCSRCKAILSVDNAGTVSIG